MGDVPTILKFQKVRLSKLLQGVYGKRLPRGFGSTMRATLFVLLEYLALPLHMNRQTTKKIQWIKQGLC